VVKPLYISTSQIDTFTLCNRKWWFDKVLHLPKPHKPFFAFGHALHGCLERWILSTSNGRVPDDKRWKRIGEGLYFAYTEGPFESQVIGASTELFPAGFETVTEKDGFSLTLTPNEVAQIKRLTHQAIERGIITKDDDVLVEQEYELPLIEGVQLVGKMDLLYTGDNFLGVPEIHDHKSFSKSAARFLKQPGPTSPTGQHIPIVAPYQSGDGTSPNSVGHVQQNLTYAWAYCNLKDYHGLVLVRHNQFPKFDDGKGVRFVDALVDERRIDTHGGWLTTVAADMVKVSKIKKWEDTPPPSTPTACSDFGGCDFQDICGHRINTAVYSERTKLRNTERDTQPRPNFPLDTKRFTNKTMAKTNVFKTAADKRAGKTAPAATEEAAPEVNGGEAAEEAPVENGAPWAKETCTACRGLGINTKGRACPICDKTAEKDGRPPSACYELTNNEDGSITAIARPEDQENLSQNGYALEWTMPAGANAQATAAPKTAPAKPSGLFKPKAATAPAAAAPAAAPKAAPAPASMPKTGMFKPKAAPAPAAAQAAPAAQEAPSAAPSVFKRKAAPAEAPSEATEEETTQEIQPGVFKRGRGRPKGSLNKATLAANGMTEQPNALQRSIPGTLVRSAAASTGEGLILCMGANVLKGPDRPRMMAQDLLAQLGAEMATDMGAGSFWELDPKKRQDVLKQNGAALAQMLGRTVVIFPGGTNDFDLIALHNSLAPFAEWCFEGTR
jgi:PD-(D/E)XK nuclease superfamily protein